MKQRLTILTSLFTFFFMINLGLCQQNGINKSENPLSGFEQLIGGEWHQESGYQTFRWGVGKKSVVAENYFIINGEPRKVSQGAWFWHPGVKEIKGYFTAINMPVEFFDYTTRYTDTGIESDLTAYDSTGAPTHYLEIWEFENKDRMKWTLYSVGKDTNTKVMGGLLIRQ